jgi:predicted nucleic acid-binding protein
MALRVYLDTSVFSARFDERAPERMRLTEAFFARLGEFEASTSVHTRDELGRTPDRRRRAELLELLENTNVIPVPSDAKSLAERYVEAGVFAHGDLDDAIHVAAAVLSQQSVLVSWNFKHLVNRRKRASLNSANVAWGLPEIDIVAPPEL